VDSSTVTSPDPVGLEAVTSQALSFEWHVKHARVSAGSPCERRRLQINATLRNPVWWNRYPPCPKKMTVRCSDGDLMHFDSDLPVSVPSVLRKATCASISAIHGAYGMMGWFIFFSGFRCNGRNNGELNERPDGSPDHPFEGTVRVFAYWE
jgi:hypothetical protein